MTYFERMSVCLRAVGVSSTFRQPDTTLVSACLLYTSTPTMSPPASKYSMAACPMASVPANPTAPLMAQPSTGTTPTAVRAMLRNRNAPVSYTHLDVVADQDCTVLFLNLAKVVGPCSCRCDHHALVARNMIAAIARQSLALSRRIFHVAPKSIRGKVLAYLSNEAERTGTREFDIPFNRQQLADYLGVDRSALSAELSRMQKAGLIRCRRNHFALPHSPSNSTCLLYTSRCV